MLNHVVQYQRADLDSAFAALSDARFETELAGKFQMTLAGLKKHICVRERTGLVTTENAGRVRTGRLGPCRLEVQYDVHGSGEPAVLLPGPS
jgi:hypothetical protein